MPKSNAEELRILSRQSKVAALLVRGQTNHCEITRALGMDDSQRRTITRDIAAIKEQWKQSALFDYNEAKGKELARLDAVEAEAWAAWERSKIEKQSTRTKRHTRPGKPAADGKPSPSSSDDEAEVKKEQRDGEPKWLDVVLGCVDKRCDILGLDAPKRIAPTTPDGSEPWKPNLTLLSNDQLEALDRLAALAGGN